MISARLHGNVVGSSELPSGGLNARPRTQRRDGTNRRVLLPSLPLSSRPCPPVRSAVFCYDDFQWLRSLLSQPS